MKKPMNNNAKRVSGKEFILNDRTSFAVLEAYKSLRTNVMFALPGKDCKCIGITSSVAGEGKSTTAVNLAISLAQIGKRVLLIDCDLRLPTVSAKLGIRPTPGLCDFLIGEVRIDEAIRCVEKHGIHVLPASHAPADPTGLLESRQMEQLFTALRRAYEYVIVDLPPVTVVSDALILSKCLDGFLLVLHEKQTKHRTVEDAMRNMEFAGAKILGAVLCGSEVTEKHYDYYYGNGTSRK